MKLKITLLKSYLHQVPKNRGTIKALGLRKIGQSTVKEDSPVLKGMLRQVNHLVKVEKISE
jgi:large subunit ribosomal protein L30